MGTGGYYDGKVAVITGAASGIGLGLSCGLLERGVKAVFMADFNEEALVGKSRELESKHPGRVFSALTDVTSLEQVRAVVERARDFDGHLDFLFNNAGIGLTLPVERVTFDMWRSVVDLNLMGVVHGTYTAIPIMRSQGSGHIINTGSVAGRVPIPYQAVYAATKSAVISMTECLQYELENEGLSFSVFCPGNVRTSIFKNLEPPVDSIPVEEAVDYVLDEVERKALIVLFPQEVREADRIYREDRERFDEMARELASVRRENYRTKGTYF